MKPSAKFVVPAVLLVAWLFSLFVFWCVIGPTEALGFGILFLYGLMPAAILGTSLASGLLRPYGRMSWVVVPAAAVLYLLLPWLTFGLANTLSFGRLNPPDPVALAAGAVVPAAGFGIGAGVRALRARRRGA